MGRGLRQTESKSCFSPSPAMEPLVIHLRANDTSPLPRSPSQVCLLASLPFHVVM